MVARQPICAPHPYWSGEDITVLIVGRLDSDSPVMSTPSFSGCTTEDATRVVPEKFL